MNVTTQRPGEAETSSNGTSSITRRLEPGHELAGEPLDPVVFDRFAVRLAYVSGNFTDPATFQRVGEAIKGKELPVFYLEIPPFSSAPLSRIWAEARLTKTARIVVEKAVRP